jgi:hypothetical protein
MAESTASVVVAEQRSAAYAMESGMGVANVQKMKKPTNSSMLQKRLAGNDATAVGQW